MNKPKIQSWSLWGCTALVLGGLGLRFYQYAITISNYPITTYWSESYRIYSASLVYSNKIFGHQFPWPWMDPGRSILDGLVLLIPGTQIWIFRFWLAFLTLATSTLASIVVINRASRISGSSNKKSRLFMATLAGWGILFFLQCPIYYHVLLGAIVVLSLFDLAKPVLTLIVVLITSAWEGLCRVNWFLIPALLVITVYFLTIPMSGKKLTRYLLWPIIWFVAGALASFLTYGLFIKISHYIIPFYNPDMHYGFFKFKLWPNKGFTLGLIPGIILLSTPVIVLILTSGLRNYRKLHWIRSVVLLSILAIFFVGSTIVSLRSGGGFDLHNYDTYVLILFVVGVYWGRGAIHFDKPESEISRPLLDNRLLLLGLLSIPIFFAIRDMPAHLPQSEQDAGHALWQVQVYIQKTDISKGPVLLIDYRHLLVYREIPPVDVYLPYEKIELMEMSMANNRPYLDQFWKDIEKQKFPLIISEKLQLAKQGVKSPFGNENNIWVSNVSEPILRYYQLVYSEGSLAIYAPKAGIH